ncbi:MAG: HAD family hydrolase [Pseudomonadota bacterium]|nr:HAD family hydrolase [Pseudomonadota bacterium]
MPNILPEGDKKTSLRDSIRNLKAVVFDFDGTIAGLTIDFAEMRRRVLEHLRGSGVNPDGLARLYVLEMIAAGKERIGRFFPGKETKYEREALALVREMEVSAAQSGHLFSGIRDALSQLRSQGRRTAVVTRNCREAVTAVFPDIDAFMDVVMTRDDTPLVKPHPVHLHRALAALASPAPAAAMVGDHGMDMILARDVGVLAIGVLTGHDTARELEAAGAEVILPSASELVGFLSSSRGR